MIYSFKCRDCGEVFEVNESLAEHEKHREACPSCKSNDVQQLFNVQVKTSKKS